MAGSKISALPAIGALTADDLVAVVDDAAGTPATKRATIQNILDLGTGTVLASTCEGRLTTESGVPVSTADRVAQSTLYFTPYRGNRVALYSGTAWVYATLVERSLALTGLTTDKNYDVFLWNNAGTLTLEPSAAWTSDTVRADALALQDGIRVKASATTRRHVGTIRATGATTTADASAARFVWNATNQRARPLSTAFTAVRTTTSTSFVEVHTEIRAQFVLGDVGDVSLVVSGTANNSTSGQATLTALGVDGTTPIAPSGRTGSSISQRLPAACAASLSLPAGYHYATLLGAVSGGTGDWETTTTPGTGVARTEFRGAVWA